MRLWPIYGRCCWTLPGVDSLASRTPKTSPKKCSCAFVLASPKFDRSRDGLSWAFGIAHYEVMSQRRRLRRRREISDESLGPRRDDQAHPEEHVIERQLLATLSNILGELTPEDQLALGLVASPHAESSSGPALRKRKQRALERLRDVWRGLYGRP